MNVGEPILTLSQLTYVFFFYFNLNCIILAGLIVQSIASKIIRLYHEKYDHVEHVLQTPKLRFAGQHKIGMNF